MVFLNWLADAIGRWGVRLLRLANRIAPPSGTHVNYDDWIECGRPTLPDIGEREPTTMPTVELPTGTYRVDLLKRRSNPPPKGQA